MRSSTTHAQTVASIASFPDHIPTLTISNNGLIQSGNVTGFRGRKISPVISIEYCMLIGQNSLSMVEVKYIKPNSKKTQIYVHTHTHLHTYTHTHSNDKDTVHSL